MEHLIYSSSCIKLVITSELSSQFHSPLSIPVSCSLKIHNCIQWYNVNFIKSIHYSVPQMPSKSLCTSVPHPILKKIYSGFPWPLIPREVTQAWHWDFYLIAYIFWEQQWPPMGGSRLTFLYVVVVSCILISLQINEVLKKTHIFISHSLVCISVSTKSKVVSTSCSFDPISRVTI